MSSHSFLFSGLDKETLDLAQELQSLGGGDATVSKLEVHAIIDAKIRPKDCQVLFGFGKSVGIRDTLLPRNHPTKENMKSYPVTSVMTDTTFHKEQLSSDICAWALQGFNSCLLTVGVRDSTSSNLLFGEFGTLDGLSLTCSLLEKLFDNLDSDLRQTIAMSAWMIQDQHIIDLLAPHASHRATSQFVSVECPEFSTAKKVLQEAISRQPGAHNPSAVKECDRGHLFVKLMLHSRPSDGDDDSGTLSTIHLVSLLGLVDIDNSKVYSKLSEEDRIATRSHNIELNSVFKVLSEMRSVSIAASSGSDRNTMKMTSARNTRLSSVLAPLIQGNAKTFISLSLQDGEGHAMESKNLFTSLQGVTDILNACHRITGVSLRSLDLQQYDSVLGPHYSSARPGSKLPGATGGSRPRVEENPRVGPAPSLQQPPPPPHKPSLSPQSPMGNLSVVSEDYGDVDLQAVLNEDYSSTTRKRNQSVPHPKPAVAHSELLSQTSRTEDLVRQAISSEVNKTMDEFHDLMEELQNDSATRGSSLLLGQKVAVNRFLNEKEELERSQIFNERSRSFLSTGISHLSGGAHESSGNLSRYSSQSSPQRHQSGSYRGMLSEPEEEEPIQSSFTPSVNRSVLRPMDDALNSSINRAAAEEVEGVADAAVLEMIRALRELQRNASQADRTMIESEITRLITGSGSISSTPIPSFKTSSSRTGFSGIASRPLPSQSMYDDEAVDNATSYLSKYDESIDKAVHSLRVSASRFNRRDEGDADEVLRVEDAEEDDEPQKESQPMKQSNEIETGRRAAEEEEEDQTSVHSDSLTREAEAKSIQAHPVSLVRSSSSAPPLVPLQALTSSLELLKGGLTSGEGQSNAQSYSNIFQEKLRAFHSASQDCSEDGNRVSSSSVDVQSSSVASELHKRTNGSVAVPVDGRVSFRQEASVARSSLPSTQEETGVGLSSSSNPLSHSGTSLVLDEGIPDKVYSNHLESTQEIEKLRRTSQSLMEALREEKALRLKTEESLLKARDDVLEIRTQCEVEMDNYKLEIVQLKNQIRSLCDDYSLSDVFNSFEESVSRLVRENSILRKQNIQLELLELDILENKEKYLPHSLDQEDGNRSINGPSDRVRTQTLLKRVSKERDALKEMCEELRKKERHYDLNAKLTQDAARRLKISHQELNKTKKELEQALLESNVHERDLHLLRQETVELKKSEGFLKSERAKMIAEVAQLRERVRELDDEKKQHMYLSKFVAKHSQPANDDPFCNNNNSSVPKSVMLTNFGKLMERENQSQMENRRPGQHPPHSSSGHKGLNIPAVRDKSTPGAYGNTLGEGLGLAVSGVAGLSDAQYTRHEERAGGVSDNADLEVLLNAMHEGIIAHTPSLLPVFRKLNNEIYADRTRSLEQRAKLLEKAYPVTSVPLSPSKNNKGKLDTHVPVKTYSKNFGDQAHTTGSSTSNVSSNSRRQVRF